MLGKGRNCAFHTHARTKKSRFFLDRTYAKKRISVISLALGFRFLALGVDNIAVAKLVGPRDASDSEAISKAYHTGGEAGN